MATATHDPIPPELDQAIRDGINRAQAFARAGGLIPILIGAVEAVATLRMTGREYTSDDLAAECARIAAEQPDLLTPCTCTCHGLSH